MEAQMSQLMTLFQERLQSDINSGNGVHTTSSTPTTPRQLGFIPKLDFPSFSGENSRGWVQKCEKYFHLCKIPDDQKVDIAGIHLSGKAGDWFNAYMAARVTVSWSSFVLDLCARFVDDVGDNVVEKFNKLHQLGSLNDYLDSFEYLKSLMIQRNPLLNDALFLDSFIGGLKPVIKPFVKAFKPATIAEAVAFARLQEESVEATRTYSRFSGGLGSKSVGSGTVNKSPLLPTPTIPADSKSNTSQRHLTMAERADKIAKGICYFCDKPYVRGHKCSFKKPQLFTILVPGDSEEDSDSESVQEGYTEVGDTEFEVHSIDPHISINALHGSQSFQTMRVTGYMGRKPLHILIDSGSTHNFLDLDLARKLNLQINPISPQSVAVADGNHLACQHVCPNFQWKLQNTEFQCEALLIPLGSCDMVLGVQWLSTLGTVKWNFNKLWMSFEAKGIKHVLRGISPKVRGDAIATPKLMANAIHLFYLQVTEQHQLRKSSPVSCFQLHNTEYPEGIEKLLQEYSVIFKEPKSLPPSRGIIDHKIPLEVGVNPVSIRPYRYALKQRDIIEKLIQEMLDKGVIQQSCSPFASPVVLVGKKDGSWRLCVDYRELNKKTIKDKFPIPVVDELIDELAGATIFTKLDLRAGYHQLRMAKEDVFKTAFKTHSGHYEFLVMPFGLTNAPASFQAWMNQVFRPLLRKCVLVFFDDILVYSDSLVNHISHLRLVFELMKQQHMFAKLSKCAFASAKVEYLGHFISGVGVETDSRKIKAVQEWPTPKTVKELRSFLGLAGYYRKFVKGYAEIAKPLTTLLKKDGFQWSLEADLAFQALKNALVTAPVLSVPDFSKEFVVETDASQSGIGASDARRSSSGFLK
ncbi:uncharacterized protein LOC141654920 [Silene latifolia]|uniref:uncharacterized protein LOC141654920 n=1 Tax=Silene latifolia TaxID=37657 RepID=UPI003D76C125